MPNDPDGRMREVNIDLSKLTPAPWKVCDSTHEDAEPGEAFVVFGGRDDLSTDSTMMDYDHAAFITLARNAFDVLMRRGWSLDRSKAGRWWVSFCGIRLANGDDATSVFGMTEFADPFTALVEADRWYKENVESGRK